MVMYPLLEEVQRLQYLQALGITSWLPTRPLVADQDNGVLWREPLMQANNTSLASGASVTSAIVSSSSALSVVTAVAAPVTQNVDQSQDQAQIQAATIAGALSALSSAPVTREPSSVPQEKPVKQLIEATRLAPAVSVSSIDTDDWIAPLHLGLSWYANGVLVVNDIPAHEGATMSSPIQRLQTAIVNALRPMLKESSIQVLPQASMEFNWPLVPGPHGDHSLTGAQSGLKYSLLKLLKDNPCRKLLVMGPVAAQLLKPGMTLGESVYIELSDMVIASVYSHSLHQLLVLPSLKAETWKHLQSLLAADPIV